MAMSSPEFRTKMQAKHDELARKGVNFGMKLSESPLFYGSGSVVTGHKWIYEKGAIYCDDAVTGGFAIPVYGGIYQKYKSLGAEGFNSEVNAKLLGLPTRDEEWDKNYLHRVSQFQNGVIFLSDATTVDDPNSSGVVIFGDIYKAWRSLGGENSELGYPIGERFNFYGGHAVYFERGCMWQGKALGGKVVTSYVRPPLFGNPKMIDPSNRGDLVFKDMVAFVGLTPEDKKELSTLIPATSGKGNFYANLWKNLFINRVTKQGEPRHEIWLPPIDFTSTHIPLDVVGGVATADVISGDTGDPVSGDMTDPTPEGAYIVYASG
jgi:hypothetical protein